MNGFHRCDEGQQAILREDDNQNFGSQSVGDRTRVLSPRTERAEEEARTAYILAFGPSS